MKITDSDGKRLFETKEFDNDASNAVILTDSFRQGYETMLNKGSLRQFVSMNYEVLDDGSWT